MEDSLSSPISEQHLLNHPEEAEAGEPPIPGTKKKLALIPLVFLIYFEVSGGPYGEEYTVGAAGPLFAILGFLIFPFLWSVPEALVTAELATAFPGNGGYIIWATEAFGPFWGCLMGLWKFTSGVANLASYPVLCIDYLKLVIPALSSGFPRYLAIFLSTCFLSFLNYTGLTIVGYTAVALGIVSLMPFLLLSLISIPKIEPGRWLSLGQKGVEKDWTLFFNTLFWNLNFWDNASTMAGAIPLEQEKWVDGYFAEVAEMIAGKWLKFWMELGAALSIVGLYEAQLSSAAYQILGMADLGFIPQIFGVRSRWFKTPWMGILISTVIALVVSNLSFTNIISIVNLLYCLGMLLEFASYLWLRRKFPSLKRPFEVPMKFPGLVAMCLVPSVFLVYVMTIASTIAYVASAVLTAMGIVLYYFMNLCKSKKRIEFSNAGEKLEDEEEDDHNL
ncbi:hypothetical protein L6164_025350 [Bauhinia variegata]|uniref:Uncharacterized protein n=1 Tax=Bauhinia variegata TaxID=167791 RepID=A0ACB9M0G7_BAUVA|nr:hypothetical protein L6164_025350 [Bauhinia variegata]